jgi:uncharacterized protein
MERTASSSTDRAWAVGAHLTVLANVVPIPLAGLLSSFAAFALTRARGGFAHDHAREALNLQLTLVLVGIALAAASIASLTTGPRDTAEKFVVVYAIAGLVAWSMTIVAAIFGAARAGQGETVRFPFVLRFLREPGLYR